MESINEDRRKEKVISALEWLNDSSPSNLFQKHLSNKAKPDYYLYYLYQVCVLFYKGIIIEVPLGFLLEWDKFTYSLRLFLTSSVTTFSYSYGAAF